jgi:SRSO17 transposase
MRWRTERDCQDLKQDFGLGHYEGRGWRGFHHHATLSIAAYGFLMARRLKMGGNQAGIKKFHPAPSACRSPGFPASGKPGAHSAMCLIRSQRCACLRLPGGGGA